MTTPARNRAVVALTVALTAGPLFADPGSALAFAVEDACELARTEAGRERLHYVRYLDLSSHEPGDKPGQRGWWARLLTMQLNALSREAHLTPPRVVAGGNLLAFDLRDYRIDKFVYGRLNGLTAGEPYFHVVVRIDEHGRSVKKSDYAPWMNPVGMKLLIELTGSSVPILRGDWFFGQTCIQAGRGKAGSEDGHGYYDFLGVKNRDDYFRLVGVDVKRARERQSELSAVVIGTRSGVAQNTRQVVRLGADDGGAWFTLDVFDADQDVRNGLRLLDRDKGYKHDAEEHFGRLPNGLWAVIACDDRGNLQDSAPDKIGSDKTARGNDRRIHSAKSCFSCHVNGGLQDLEDEVRATFTPGKGGTAELGSVEYYEALKLRRLFLRDLAPFLAKDRLAYTLALKECCGMTPPELAAAYREGYELYYLAPVTLELAANELGCTPADLTRKIVAFRKTETNFDPSLAPLVVGRPLSRTNFEELYPTLQKIMRDYP
jgi:hypothetical protein